jgi:peptide/nickel transport system permease protein
VLLFIVRRLAWGVVLVFVITLITFIIFLMLPAERPQATQGLVTPNLQTQFDLTGRSLPGQYVHFLDRVFLHGDLGDSMRQTITVREIITRSLPVTISLVIGGTLMWMLLAFTIGVLSALRPRSLLDKSLMTVVLIGVSAHPVWLGLIFSYTFGFKAHIFPIAGYCDFKYDPSSPNLCGGPRYWAYHLVLPWFTFSLLFAALYARMIRASILETMHEDYVRTAIGKGAGSWRVMRKHVMQNAMLPVVTMMGMDVALAFSGAIFIETVFQLPGMGQVLYRALTTSDTPVIMGVILVVTIAVVVLNMIVDILISVLDPRVGLRSGHTKGATPLRRARTRYRVAEVGESQEAQASS